MFIDNIIYFRYSGLDYVYYGYYYMVHRLKSNRSHVFNIKYSFLSLSLQIVFTLEKFF